MPRPMKWGLKFVTDPIDNRYAKIVGKYDEEFLDFARAMGQPTWEPPGIQGIVSRHRYWVREPEAVTFCNLADQSEEMEILDRGLLGGWFIPLAVLEPLFDKIWDRSHASIINPHTGKEMPLKW